MPAAFRSVDLYDLNMSPVVYHSPWLPACNAPLTNTIIYGIHLTELILADSPNIFLLICFRKYGMT